MNKIEVRWSEPAWSDLLQAVKSMQKFAPRRAEKFMRRLVSAAQQLQSFPESGRYTLDLADETNLREVIVENFRLIYSYIESEQRVDVLAVFNAQQDVPKLFESRFSGN